MSHINDEGGLVLDAGERAALARYAVARSIGQLRFEWEDMPLLAEATWLMVEKLCETISAETVSILHRQIDPTFDGADLWERVS